MDAVKNLNRSRQEPSGVWGVERTDSGDGNWGGPPRSGDLRVCHRKVESYNRFHREMDVVPGGRRRRPSYCWSRADNITAGEGRAAASSMRIGVKEEAR